MDPCLLASSTGGKVAVNIRGSPEDVIQVVIEEQPHWPTRNAMTNAESKAMLICDFAHGTRRVWRMVLPDGTPFAVTHHETKSEGLKQTFPPDLLPDRTTDEK